MSFSVLKPIASGMVGLLLVACTSVPIDQSADSRPSTPTDNDLNARIARWVDREVTAQLLPALADHDRFKRGNQWSDMVVLAQGEPGDLDPRAPALRVARDAAETAVLRSNKVHLGSAESSAGPCGTTVLADYVISVTGRLSGGDRLQLRIRIREGIDGKWLGGYGMTHDFMIAADDAPLIDVNDPADRGERNSPYAEAETDLLAWSLARQLICSIGVVPGPVPTRVGTVGTGADSQRLARLLAGELSKSSAFALVDERESAQLQINISLNDTGTRGLRRILAVPVVLMGDPELPSAAAAYQRVEPPPPRGENWRAIADLAARPSAWPVSMSLPHSTRVGEQHRFAFSSARRARLWVIEIAPDDTLKVVFPKRADQLDSTNLFEAGQPKQFRFRIKPPIGEYLYTVVSTGPNRTLADVLANLPVGRTDVDALADRTYRGIDMIEPLEWGLIQHVMTIEP